MKNKLLVMFIILVAIAVLLCGCEKEIASKEAINTRFTPAHSEVETDYTYKYSWLQENFVLVPNVHTVTYPDKYEVEYLVTYIDGTTATKWEEVTESEYKSVLAEMEAS